MSSAIFSHRPKDPKWAQWYHNYAETAVIPHETVPAPIRTVPAPIRYEIQKEVYTGCTCAKLNEFDDDLSKAFIKCAYCEGGFYEIKVTQIYRPRSLKEADRIWDRLRNAAKKRRQRKTEIGRLIHRYRNMLYHALTRNKGLQKSKKSITYLGCSWEFFREWLEKTWVNGMTWDNYGDLWEIDHIQPISSFDFAKESEIHKCFHYSNMRALSVVDNQRKGNRIYS